MQEIQENIAQKLRTVMESRKKTISDFADELDIPSSSLKNYLRGTSNPRADTIALLADRLDLTPAELISDLPTSTIQAKLVFRAAKEIGELAPDQREVGIQLFLALVELFSAQNEADRPSYTPE